MPSNTALPAAELLRSCEREIRQIELAEFAIEAAEKMQSSASQSRAIKLLKKEQHAALVRHDKAAAKLGVHYK